MSKRKVNTYKVSQALSQRERIHKFMEVIDSLKEAGEHLGELIDKVAKRHGTFDDLLEAVFEYEANCLEDKRLTQWEKNAKFTLEGRTFDNFNFSFPKKIDMRLINELRSFRFIEEHKHVLIVGPLGVGKSHIACALGREALERGYETRCMTLVDIVKEVNNTIDSRRDREHRIANLVKMKLLIVDDVEDTEKLGNFNEEATDFLYTIMRKRYESNNSSTILTFNESFKGWDEIFGSQERAKKLIDRILERRHILKIEGESYREKLGNEEEIITRKNSKSHSQKKETGPFHV